MDETPEQEARRLRLERQCADLGTVIGSCMPEGVGFAFVMFDFGGEGNMAYLSSGAREDLIKMLAELHEKLIRSRQ